MGSKDQPKEYDLITFGDMCVDLIVSGHDVTPRFGQVEKLVDEYVLEMGGSCCIFACQAARLGLRVAILGKVGQDSFGDLILRRLGECGVDTRGVVVDPELKTGLGIALCPPGDRAILTYMGTINALRPEDIHEADLASTRHLHHGSYYLHTGLRPGIAKIFRRARSLGMSTSLDPNWDPEEKWDAGLDQVLQSVSVFMPNEQEALHITGCTDIETAIQRLQERGIEVIALKQGEKGARLYQGKMTWERQEALTAMDRQAISEGDSVGAGDSFDAGFLAGWLRGLPMEKCLEIACFCGRSVASKTGGLAGQPTWDQIVCKVGL